MPIHCFIDKYLLTHSRSWVLLEKLPIMQPLKNFPEFNGAWRFGTVFKRALQWSLSWAISIQSIPSYRSKIHFNGVYPPTSWSSQWSLSFWLSHQYPICIPLLPNLCCMPRPFHRSWLDHYNYTWRRVQVMKLLIVQFSPISCRFIPLRSTYSPLQAVLNDPQSMFLPLCQGPSFTPIMSSAFSKFGTLTLWLFRIVLWINLTFDFLAVVTTNRTVFWNATSYSRLEFSLAFRRNVFFLYLWSTCKASKRYVRHIQQVLFTSFSFRVLLAIWPWRRRQ
jgi:hypothetical protein